MEYRYLGDTGIQVSSLSLGTMNFFAEADLTTSTSLLDLAADAGVNFIDTADLYSNGEAEKFLGQILKNRRANFVLATKSYFPTGENLNSKGNSRKHILGSIEASLRRMKTDFIDLFYLHRFDENTPLETSIRALDQAVQSGKILHYGFSNFAAWQVMEGLAVASKNHLAPPSVIQPMYNLLKRQAEVELLPMAKHKGLGCVTYSPLGAGLLTGKFHDQKLKDGQATRMDTSKPYQLRYGSSSTQEKVVGFLNFCTERGLNPIHTAINWIHSNPAITSVLLGARNKAQLKACLTAIDNPLSTDNLKSLQEAIGLPASATDRREEQLGASVSKLK